MFADIRAASERLEASTRQDMERRGITVEYHTHDGFTLYGMASDGYLAHRRFIGYDLTEAVEVFGYELA